MQKPPSSTPKTSHKIRWKLITPIIVALIGATGLVLAALVKGPTLIFLPTPTPSSATIVSPTPTNTLALLSPGELYRQITSRPIALSDSLNVPDTNQWDAYRTASIGGCGFQQNAYHAFTFKPTIAECLAKATSFGKNFAYQVDMTTIKGDGGGMIFGAESGSTGKYRFYVNTGSYCDLFAPLDGKGKRLFKDTHTPIKAGFNQSNRLTVIVLSNTLYLYVNGVYLDSVPGPDGGFRFGPIGLFALAVGKYTDVMFHNVKVWELS